MSIELLIELLAQVIQFFILIILLVTLVYIYFQYKQQNKIFTAQLLRDRFEMYIQMYTPLTDDHLQTFKDFPENWINTELYEAEYKNDEKKIRRYILMSKTYEYLAFTYQIQVLNIRDLLGKNWIRKWTKDLIEEEEFIHVHECYKGYYPSFEKFVDSLINRSGRF